MPSLLNEWIKRVFAALLIYQAPMAVFWDTYAETFKEVVRD